MGKVNENARESMQRDFKCKIKLSGSLSYFEYFSAESSDKTRKKDEHFHLPGASEPLCYLAPARK